MLSNSYYPAAPTSSYGENEVVTANSTKIRWECSISVDAATGYDYNTISLDFSVNEDLELFGRAIRFAFTCGNDVHAPVPEPDTMILFGIGLIGLAGLGRRKFKKL